TTGGTCPIGVETYVVTALTAAGETTASPAVTVLDTTTTSSNVVSWTGVPGATGYNVYNTALGTFVGTTVAPTTTLTDITCALVPLGAAPGANTAVIPPPSGLVATANSAPGILGPGTYFYKVTALDAVGETLPSAPSN